MRNLILLLVAALSFTITHAQEKVKKEGAHEAEYNAKQNEPPGQIRTSDSMYDASDVSVSNEALPATDSSTTEENTMVPVSGERGDIDGTGNQAEATLNVAGSPVPGSAKLASKTGTVKSKSPAVNKSKDAPAKNKAEATKKSKKGKRK